jgi:hypothetical protein
MAHICAGCEVTVKKTLLFLILLSSICLWSSDTDIAGRSCSDFSWPAQPLSYSNWNTNDHVFGNHSFNANLSGSCTYFDSPYRAGDCIAHASAWASASMSEWGLSIGACHVTVYGTDQGQSQGATASATSRAAGAVKNCFLCSCGLNIDFGVGITFPPNAVWTDAIPFAIACEHLTTPIVIDTAGEGYHLTDAEHGVKFDFYGNGHPIQIAWTAADSRNAFLVLDRDQNGKIDNGQELFGNITPQFKSDRPNGYVALAVYDAPERGGNSDGVIDEKDKIFSYLRLWIDANHDGVSQTGELHTLPEMGVYSLSLNYKESRHTDQYGNQFRYRAKVNPNGQPAGDTVDRVSYDVFLVTK